MNGWYEGGAKQFSGTFHVEQGGYFLKEITLYMLKGTSWYTNGVEESEETGVFKPSSDEDSEPKYLISYTVFWPNGKKALESKQEDPISVNQHEGCGGIPTETTFFFPDGHHFLYGQAGHEYWQAGIDGTHWPAYNNEISFANERELLKKDQSARPYKPMGNDIDGHVLIDLYNSSFMERDPSQMSDDFSGVKIVKKGSSISMINADFKNGICIGTWVVNILFGYCEFSFDENGFLKSFKKSGDDNGDVVKEFNGGFLTGKDTAIEPPKAHHRKSK